MNFSSGATERYGGDPDPGSPPATDRDEIEVVDDSLEAHDAKRGVFVSYRRADSEAVKKFVGGLESMGLNVWWDKQDISAGDWQHKINKGIRDCQLFLPMLSKHAQDPESMARAEWHKALERLPTISRDVPYIIPILLDNISEDADHIPPEFWQQNYYRAPDGEVDEQTLTVIRDAYRSRISRAAGRSA